MIGSARGGVNIEEVAVSEPDAIIKVPIDIKKGVTNEIANQLAEKIGFEVNLFTRKLEPILCLGHSKDSSS